MIAGLAPRGAMRVARVHALAAIAVLGVSVACYSPRSRLVPPTLVLVLDDTITVAGGTVSGRATATDASGITSLAVLATTGDSSFQAPTQHYVRADSVDVAFTLHVSAAATPGTAVEVVATTSDDQSFTIRVRDTAFVRATP